MSSTSEGLRQRPATSTPRKMPSFKMDEAKVKTRTKTLDQLLSSPMMPRIARKAAPALATGFSGAEAAFPLLAWGCHYVHHLYLLAKPYHVDDLVPLVLGLAMAFFGGYFPLVIAAVEAFRMCGWSSVKTGVLSIIADANTVMSASKKDDAVDADGDGVADVEQIDGMALAQRKAYLAARVVDPAKLDSALTGIQGGLMSVAAALKLEFARAVALGASIGGVLTKPLLRHGMPLVKPHVPAEMHKWVKPGLEYAVKCFSISCAWWLQRYISAFHSAVRGGQIAGECAVDFAHKLGVINVDSAHTHLDEIVGMAIAALGFMSQISGGFRLGFPLNILLFPLTLCEWTVRWVIQS